MERVIDARQLADEIASRLAALSSRTTPAARSVRREYSRLLAKTAPDTVIRVGIGLASRSEFACRFVGYEIVKYHKGAAASLTPSQILELGQGIDGWGAVDCFACDLSGPALRDGLLSDAMIRGWACSDDRWWRRAALVSTVALSRRGDAADVRSATEICSLAVNDRDDMVVKALSWALRELAKKHAKEVRRFLRQHEGKLASRVVREVRNKITTGLKNPRR